MAQSRSKAGGGSVSRETIRSVLEQLDRPVRQTTLEVDRHRLALSNLDKPLWPAAGRRPPLTKRDLLRYFTRVSPWMLLHLADRPLFVTRFPNGVTGKSFYQKHWKDPPPFVRTVSIWSSHNAGDGDYLICENLPTLLWLGQMAGLELHAWYSRTRRAPDARRTGATFTGSEEALDHSVLNYPDFVVFDLDPYLYSGKEAHGEEPELHRRAFGRTRTLALRVREMLGRLGLETWIKTSGRTGLHLYLPIVRTLDFDAARLVAEAIARHARAERPREVTVEWAVERRRGKIFFDYNQNVRGKSLAVPYSPRRHPGGTVATPVSWEELESIYPTDFTLRTVPERLEAGGDPWAGIFEAKQDLAAALDGRRVG
jgi:bifunctional non-homologous end joining protein LigD